MPPWRGRCDATATRVFRDRTFGTLVQRRRSAYNARMQTIQSQITDLLLAGLQVAPIVLRSLGAALQRRRRHPKRKPRQKRSRSVLRAPGAA